MAVVERHHFFFQTAHLRADQRAPQPGGRASALAQLEGERQAFGNFHMPRHVGVIEIASLLQQTGLQFRQSINGLLRLQQQRQRAQQKGANDSWRLCIKVFRIIEL